MKIDILIISDGVTGIAAAADSFAGKRLRVRTAGSPLEGLRLLQDGDPDVLLLAHATVQASAAVLTHLNELLTPARPLQCEVLLFCRRADAEAALALCERGICDDCLPGWQDAEPAEWLLFIRRALRHHVALTARRAAPSPIAHSPRLPPAPPRLPTAGEAAVAGRARARTLSVLVVEDDPICRALLEGTLQRAGYDVRVAEDGVQALALLRTVRPAAILLDVVMPYLDGLAVLARLRQLPGLERVPVLLLTGMTGQEVHDAAARHKVSAVLAKPADQMAVVQAVDDCLLC